MATQAVVNVCDSFEHGLLTDELYASFSNASIETGAAQYGERGLRLSATSGRAYLTYGGSTGDQITSFNIRFNSLPISDCYIAHIGQVSSGVHYLGIAFNSATGKLRAFGEDGSGVQYGADGFTPAEDVWYCIDMLVDSPEDISWAVDEAAQPSANFSGLTGGGMGVLLLGNKYGATTTFEIDFDDAVSVVATAGREPSYPIGPHDISTLRPVAEGTHVDESNFTDDQANSPPVNPHLRLDDNPSVANDTDFVYQSTADSGTGGSYLEYVLPDLPAMEDPAAVHAVLGYFSYKRHVGADITGFLLAKMVTGSSSESFGGNMAMGATKNWRTDYFHGAQLTRAQVNDMVLRHGFDDGDTTRGGIHDFFVNVAHSPAVSGADGELTVVLPAIQADFTGQVEVIPGVPERVETIYYDELRAGGAITELNLRSDVTVPNPSPPDPDPDPDDGDGGGGDEWDSGPFTSELPEIQSDFTGYVGEDDGTPASDGELRSRLMAISSQITGVVGLSGSAAIGLPSLRSSFTGEVGTPEPPPPAEENKAFPLTKVYVGYYGDRVSQIEQYMSNRKVAMRRIWIECRQSEKDDAVTKMILNSTAVTYLNNGVIPIITLKLGRDSSFANTSQNDWHWTDDWNDVFTGDFDAWLIRQRNDIRDKMNAHPEWPGVIFGFHHEPERDGSAYRYRRAWAHIYHKLQTNNDGTVNKLPRLRFIMVLMSSFSTGTTYYNPTDGSDPDNGAGKKLADAYWPDGETDSHSESIAVNQYYVGWDPYTWSCKGSTTTFRGMINPILSYMTGNKRKPYIFCETGRGADSVQDDWIYKSGDNNTLYETLKDLRGDTQREGCKGFLYFDRDSTSKGHCDWRLTSASQKLWVHFAENTTDYRTLK